MTPRAGEPLPARLLAVTDRRLAAAPLPERVEELLDAGLRWLWLRDRDLPPHERRALATELARRVALRGATLTVGADAELAATLGVGLHVPAGGDIAAARRRLGPGALIGASAHSPAEVGAARDAGADYATLSPVFATGSKPGYGPALGIEGLRAGAAVGLPVLALGGVTTASAAACLAAGAAGIAAMGEAMRGRDAFAALLVAARAA